MQILYDIRRRARHRAVTFASTRPTLYYGLRRATGTFDELCITSDTDLVIEGYPRSANSTTVHGFLDRQPEPVKVAHHKHHAAQLLRAVERGLPAVMLIREPVVASLSNLALAEEAVRHGGGRRRGTIGYTEALAGWLAFYRALLPHLDSLVVAPFDQVTTDIDAMIEAVNTHFGTAFAAGPPLRIREKPLGWHATPNPMREDIKRDLHAGFDRALERSARLRAMMDEASELHREVIARHERRH